jgi:hypothetical protein
MVPGLRRAGERVLRSVAVVPHSSTAVEGSRRIQRSSTARRNQRRVKSGVLTDGAGRRRGTGSVKGCRELRAGRALGARGVTREARFYFGVGPELRDDELAAVAGRYPVFRVVYAGEGPPLRSL